MVRCAVIDCEKHERKEDWQLFPLPKSGGRRQKWLDLVNLDVKFLKSIDLDKSFRVCSRHFPESDMYYETTKRGKIRKKRVLKNTSLPTLNLYRRPVVPRFKPRRTKTAMKALSEPELPEPPTKVLGRSNEEIYAVYNYKYNGDNKMERVLLPLNEDHYCAKGREILNDHTDIQREEMFEKPKPNLEYQLQQLELENQRLVQTSCLVDKIVYNDHQAPDKLFKENSEEYQDLELDVYEEMHPVKMKRVLQAIEADHHYYKGRRGWFLPKLEDSGTKIQDQAQPDEQRIYLLKIENQTLTKNLKALEKDYVLAMKSKVAKTKNG